MSGLEDEIEDFLELFLEVACAQIFLNVVARPGFDTLHHGLLVVFGGEHDDPGIPAGGADFAEGIKSAFSGKTVGHDHDIELAHDVFAVTADAIHCLYHLGHAQCLEDRPVEQAKRFTLFDEKDCVWSFLLIGRHYGEV